MSKIYKYLKEGMKDALEHARGKKAVRSKQIDLLLSVKKKQTQTKKRAVR